MARLELAKRGHFQVPYTDQHFFLNYELNGWYISEGQQ